MAHQQLKLLVITMGFIIILMSGVLVGLIFFKPAPSAITQLPAFGMEGLASADLAPRDGQELYALVLFASWCQPCRAEMPHLAGLARQMDIYGIAVQDKQSDLTDFLEEYGNPFTKIGHDNGGIMVEALGARGVPETLIVNTEGEIVYRHVGPLRPAVIKMSILPLMGARD